MKTLRNIAAFVAAFIVGSLTILALHELHMTLWPAYAMGGWFFLCGIVNAIQLGTPMWLTVTDALGYLPVALMTGKWISRA